MQVLFVTLLLRVLICQKDYAIMTEASKRRPIIETKIQFIKSIAGVFYFDHASANSFSIYPQ